MSRKDSFKDYLSRRKFLGTATAAAAFSTVSFHFGCKGETSPETAAQVPLVDSNFGGVQVGAITYSWRSMPGSAEEILQYCLDCGISSIELMGNVAEEYAGIPAGPPRPQRGVELNEEEREEFEAARVAAIEAQRQWRVSAPMEKFRELRSMYNDAGVNIHIAKFSPAGWSDEEIDYAFTAAKALGAGGVCNEIGEEACRRLAPFAEKHGLYAIFHNHGQPGEEGWSFDPFLEISPSIMLNMDVGHYFGATGLHPNDVITRLHDRIVSIHIKDKTGPEADPPDTNMPFGEGDTPIEDILKLIQANGWPINVDIELEYEIPEGSDAVQEVKKCVEYCRNILS